MKNENNNNPIQHTTPAQTPVVDEKAKQEQIKKQKARQQTAQFKAKYFEFYDDIKISDRQDW